MNYKILKIVDEILALSYEEKMTLFVTLGEILCQVNLIRFVKHISKIIVLNEESNEHFLEGIHLTQKTIKEYKRRVPFMEN